MWSLSRHAQTRLVLARGTLRVPRSVTTLLPTPLHPPPPLLPLSGNNNYFALAQHPPLSIQQRRHYLYLPTSWTELKLRLRAAAERRTIRVQLLLRQRYERARSKSQRAYLRARSKYNASLMNAKSQYNASKTKAWIRGQRLAMHRRQDVVTQWKTRTAARGTRFRNRVQGWWRRRRNDVYAYYYWRKPVTLEEYSQPDWFDAAGRPRTSRDATGRFVNPWKSESTNGVHSPSAILQWRWERLQREWKEHGWNLWKQKFINVFWPSRLLPAPCKATTETVSDALSSMPTATLSVPPAPDRLRFTWIGHATCLVQHGSINILTDPMFSVRSGPFQHLPVGVARQVPPAMDMDELPRIDLVLVSHDHYDHLDRESVRQLQRRNVHTTWVVPLGIGTWLQDKCEMDSDNIVELEWWESVRLVQNSTQRWTPVECTNVEDSPTHPAATMDDTKSLWLTCCPAQHWASRTFFDRNYRLWCSWAVFFPNASFYFAGDTALPSNFPLFEQLRDYLPPITLAALPIGAYEPVYFMRDAHLHPREAVHVHKALAVKKSVAIHYGSFELSEEPIDEPPRLLQEIVQAETEPMDFDTIPMGESIEVVCGPDEYHEEDAEIAEASY